MKTKIVLLMFMMLLLSLNVFSQSRWKYVTYGETFLCYYDTETIKYSENNVTIWVKFEYIKDEYDDNKLIDYELYKWIIYCKNRTISESNYNIYYKDGGYKNPYISSFPYEVIPDSIGEEFFRYFCK